MGPPTGGGKLPPTTNQSPNLNQQQQNQSRQQYQGYPDRNPHRTNTAPQEQLPYRNDFDERLPPQRPQQPPYEQNRGQNYGYGAMSAGSAIPPPQTVPSNQGGASYQDDFDQTDMGISVNVRYQEAQQRVAEATPNIFTSFMIGRMDNDGFDVPSDLRKRQGGNNAREIASVLQRIGDEMSNHAQLNRLISEIEVTPETVYKTFFSIASQIFADGTINWGRVCTLFYFAYKLAIQVLNQQPMIDIITNWVSKFVAQKLASWILTRGGWTSVKEYFGATNRQLFMVFFAGMAISSAFWYWKK